MKFKKNKIYKFYVALTLVIILLPQSALAQLAPSNVPVDNEYFQFIGGDTESLGISDVVGGLFGGKAKAVADLAKKAKDAMDKVRAASCITGKALELLNSAEKVSSWSFGGLSLLTGPIGESAMIKGKIESLDGAKKCVELQIKDVKEIKIANLMQGQEKQTLINDLTRQKGIIEQRLDELNAQYRLAQKSFWKSVVLQVLLKTTKTVTNRIVNDLTSQYKINDVMRYTDAVASQIYTNQLIRDQSTSGTEQLIIRSMLTNPVLKSKVHSAVYQAAADALEVNGSVFNARSIDPKDPDFYLKLSKYGIGETNPQFMERVYENRAAEMDKVGKSMAANEILVGSGLKSPRNCAGNVSQQQAIDQQWQLANDKMQNRLSLYKELKEAYDKQYASLSAKEQQQLVKDLDKAQADYLKAGAELRTTPDKFESPVLEVCKYIASPAEMINKGIDKAFDKYTDHLSQYNDGNLPYFMNLISDIGANISQSLIFGGNPKAVLLDESRNISTAANLGLSFMDSKVSEQNLSNGVDFGYTGTGGTYTLNWRNLSVEGANYVTITGPGASNVQLDSAGRPIIDEKTGQPKLNKLGTIGSLDVTAPKGGTYSLQFFDSQNRKLGNTSTITIPDPNSAVRGAAIESPRGRPVTLVEGLR